MKRSSSGTSSSVPRPSRRTRAGRARPTPATLAATLAALALARPAAADDAGPSNAVLLSIIIPLLIGAVALAVFALHAYRRDRARYRSQRLPAGPLPSSAPPSAQRLSRGQADPPGISVTHVALNLGEAEAERLPVPVLPSADIKVCRTCEREFRTALANCPFDQTRLVPKSGLEEGRSPDDYLDTRRSLMRCRTCERQYDLGAKFCPHDGDALEGVEEPDERIYFDGQMRCPECGNTFDEEAWFCPDDGVRLLPVEHGPSHQAYAALPIRICPTCKAEYPATLQRCPEDDSELLTLVGRTTGGNPTRGLGPREQICPQCGDRYGSDVRFCAADGSQLLTMN